MKLIVITPEQTATNETSVVNSLFENGLQRLHVRKPSFTADELRAYLHAITPEYHQYLVLHNHFNLLEEFNVGGIHLSSFARNDENIWMQIRHIPARMISTSFHSLQEVADNTFSYGYVFISPVFNSVSKPGYNAGIELDGVAQIKEQLRVSRQYCPLIIALGGVTATNLRLLYQYGFDGGAMLGNIWMATDPVTEFLKSRETIRMLKDA